MARSNYRFKIKQLAATGEWFLNNEWTGESVYGYATRMDAKQARQRLENGETFYDEGDIHEFVAAEKEAGHLK